MEKIMHFMDKAGATKSLSTYFFYLLRRVDFLSHLHVHSPKLELQTPFLQDL